MKLKKVLSICKANGLYYLYDRIDRSGEITQWLGDARALYPLDGLPILDEESFCAVFDITGKQREKILFRHERLPENLNGAAVAAGALGAGVVPFFLFLMASKILPSTVIMRQSATSMANTSVMLVRTTVPSAASRASRAIELLIGQYPPLACGAQHR